RTYVFIPDQSTVVQTGGIADINETHTVSGMFWLQVDFDANTAFFSEVDANLSESIYLPTQSLGELFEMYDLNSTEVNETAIKFEDDNPPLGGVEIDITVTFMGDSLHLTGSCVEPWLDGFTYNLDAVARHWADAQVVPPNPTSADVAAITVSGEWPDSCIPDGSDLSVEGNDIYFNVFSSLGEVCAAVFTPWELTESVGRLSPGTYNVYVALDRGPFALMLQFTVAGCVYYVDAADGNDLNDGLSPEMAFATIQRGIDATIDGDTVLVLPGLYLDPDPDVWESIDFLGKNITLTGSDPADPNTVKNTVIAGSVLFSGTEDANCTLTGFSIRDLGNGAIYGNHTHATISYCIFSGNGPCGATVIENCDGTISNCLITDNITVCLSGIYPVILGCHGLIKDCTIANNWSGVGVLDGGTTTMQNCIIYYNGDPNEIEPQVSVGSGGTLDISYCDVQGGLEGIYNIGDVNWGLGNIDADPCFFRLGYWDYEPWPCELTEGDYHLKSEGWRWSEHVVHDSHWFYDYVTSRCIDAGNPGSPLRDELLTVLPEDPNNDWGINLRINMGAYGGTAIASMGPPGWALLGDLSNDGIVNWLDLGGQAEDWLESANEQPGDLNRDSVVDMIDFAMLAEEWMQEAVWKEGRLSQGTNLMAIKAAGSKP
ncbi:MAG: right-handed parallel beta-helix repeat-containing protein, partial [Planctomycetota bacterium]